MNARGRIGQTEWHGGLRPANDDSSEVGKKQRNIECPRKIIRHCFESASCLRNTFGPDHDVASQEDVPQKPDIEYGRLARTPPVCKAETARILSKVQAPSSGGEIHQVSAVGCGRSCQNRAACTERLDERTSRSQAGCAKRVLQVPRLPPGRGLGGM